MKKLILALALAFSVGGAQAQQSVNVPATTGTVAIAAGTTTILKIVTGISGKSIYVTGGVLVPVATAAVTFSYGTGTNCGTGTTALTGIMTFAAGQTLNLGSGYGTTLVVPASVDLCITISTAGAPGFVSYAIF